MVGKFIHSGKSYCAVLSCSAAMSSDEAHATDATASDIPAMTTREAKRHQPSFHDFVEVNAHSQKEFEQAIDTIAWTKDTDMTCVFSVIHALESMRGFTAVTVGGFFRIAQRLEASWDRRVLLEALCKTHIMTEPSRTVYDDVIKKLVRQQLLEDAAIISNAAGNLQKNGAF